MHTHKHLITAALAATALLVALATTASARQFETSETRIRVVFRPLIFQSTEGSDRISCTVTLEGTFHYRTIAKVERSLIGYITRAAIDTANCASSPAGIQLRVLTETLPWHVQYVDFSGTLPEVRPRIRVINLGFDEIRVPILGTCKYSGSPNYIAVGPAGNGINEGTRAARLISENGIAIRSSTAFCPEIRWTSGAEPITILGGTTAVTVRLI
ncbi:MAG: hypothetical protein JSS99_07350 [Actinobacteria bacterium]|nr:hypothetical protein [Actinomycetota bacterium]